jgi:hypothetical protein
VSGAEAVRFEAVTAHAVPFGAALIAIDEVKYFTARPKFYSQALNCEYA